MKESETYIAEMKVFNSQIKVVQYLVFIAGHSGGVKKCHEPAAQTYCRKLLVVGEGERECSIRVGILLQNL